MCACGHAVQCVFCGPDEKHNAKHSNGCYFTPPQRKTHTWPLSTVQLDAPTCSSLAHTHTQHTQHRHIQYTHPHSGAGVESGGRGGGGGGHCVLKERRNKSKVQKKKQVEQGEDGRRIMSLKDVMSRERGMLYMK